MTRKPMSLERELVLMLIQRHRSARGRLRRADKMGWPEAVRYMITGEENEAHNAAQIGRRILYGLPR